LERIIAGVQRKKSFLWSTKEVGWVQILVGVPPLTDRSVVFTQYLITVSVAETDDRGGGDVYLIKERHLKRAGSCGKLRRNRSVSKKRKENRGAYMNRLMLEVKKL
jgi:hypothetical protein